MKTLHIRLLAASLALITAGYAYAENTRSSAAEFTLESAGGAAATTVLFDGTMLRPLTFNQDGGLSLFNGTTIQPPTVAAEQVTVPLPQLAAVQSPQSNRHRRITLSDGTVVLLSKRLASPNRNARGLGRS